MDTTATILIYGPDCSSTQLMQDSFLRKDVEVKLCTDANDAYLYYCEKRPLICILHELPSQESAFPLAKRILELTRDTYLIFIFKEDKMNNFRIGYQMGADDCLMIPYDLDELCLRIRAMLRRGFEIKEKPVTQYMLGKYLFDAQKGVLSIDKKKVHLTTRETDLLLLLCNKMNEVVSKEEALNSIWSAEEFANSRVLSIYVFKLRQILKDDPFVQIMTMHGVGYKLIVNPINKMVETLSFQTMRV